WGSAGEGPFLAFWAVEEATSAPLRQGVQSFTSIPKIASKPLPPSLRSVKVTQRRSVSSSWTTSARARAVANQIMKQNLLVASLTRAARLGHRSTIVPIPAATSFLPISRQQRGNFL